MDGRTRYIASFLICTFLLLLSFYGVYISHDYGKEGNVILQVTFIISVISIFILVFVTAILVHGFVNVLEIKYNDFSLYRKASDYGHTPTKEYHNSFDVAIHTENNENRKIKCFFNAKYYDLLNSETVSFQCQETAENYGFCLFHNGFIRCDLNAIENNNLNEKINKLIENRQEVFCIGYHIDYLSLKGKTIYKPIYFHDAKIEIADFSDVNFATEEAVAYFVNTSFKEVSFENTQFHGKAIFARAICERISSTQGHFYKWENKTLKENVIRA